MEYKLYCVVIFLVSVIAALLPSILTNTKIIRKVYPYITSASAGLLFAILLLDFIPHCMEPRSLPQSCKRHDIFNKTCETCTEYKAHMEKHQNDRHHGHCGSEHDYSALLCAGGVFILLIAVDSLFLHHSHCTTEDHTQHHHDAIGTCNTSALKHKTSTAQALIFIFALSLHSFFEGMSIERTAGGTYGLTSSQVGIAIHKILESFALGVTLGSSSFTKSVLSLILVVYGALTPFGIILANILKKYNKYGNGLALGSTMFIVCVEIIPSLLHSKKKTAQNVGIIGCLSAGFIVTSLLISSSHHHH